MLTKLDDFIGLAKSRNKKRVVIAAADADSVIHAAELAVEQGLVTPIFVGNKEKIEKLIKDYDFSSKETDIIAEDDPLEAARKSVKMIKENHADILMKGLVETGTFLKAILDKEHGLRTNKLLSHIAFFESPYYHKLLAMSDAAQNIAPTFCEKVYILENAVEYLRKLGVPCPKVAALAPIEMINPKIDSTCDAGLLCMMNKRGQIKNCLVDGPLALDNALSKEAAISKGIDSPVAGDPDLLLVPDLMAGNLFYKSMIYMGGATAAGILLGAQVPIVLTSRSDSDHTKLISIAMAVAQEE